jgi:hypothetical protein
MGAVPELWLPRQPYGDKNAKVRVGALAGGQKGRVTTRQLELLEVSRQTAAKWVRSGYLYPELPGVFAVGHPGRSEESDLFTAVLYAGPSAGLHGITAGRWRGLVKWRTQRAIEVSTPRRCRSLPADHELNRLERAIVVRGRREFERATYHGIPTVPVASIVLDIAATGERELVRFVLAQLDFMRRLDVPALRSVCGRGIPGSGVLHEAIGSHLPLLARARSWFEVKMVFLCEQTGIPYPELGVKIAGIRVDAVWLDQMVIVECDGEGNHGTWRQRKRDIGNDYKLRRLGFLPIRYTYDQLEDPWAIHADLMPILEERAGRARLLSA